MPYTTAAPAAKIAPRQTKHIRVVIAADGDNAGIEFAAQVTQCLFTKSGGETQTLQGGTPDAQYVDKAPNEWAVDLGVIADWEVEDSLANFLWEHEGEKATLEYMPFAGGLTYFTAEITIDAPVPPGVVGDWPTGNVVCPSTRPVRGRLTAPITPPAGGDTEE